MSEKKATARRNVPALETAIGAEPITKVPIPLMDHILISRFMPEAKTSGGMFIPEFAIQEEFVGRVVAVGPSVGLHTRTVFKEARIPQEGDMIQYGEYAGIPVNHDGKEYFLMKETAVLCILP